MDNSIDPFLMSPIQERAYQITEGMQYGTEESAIHGKINHDAIDFAAAIGSSVRAAASGFAIAGYQFEYAFTDLTRAKVRLWQNKTVGYGLGRFVLILHLEPALRDRWLYTIYGHLLSTASHIPFYEPERRINDADTGWEPIKFRQSPQAHITSAVIVKQGELIGEVGITGMEWGVEGSSELEYHPANYWDEPHTHFVTEIRGPQGEKIEHLDPFGIYADETAYTKVRAAGVGLWLPTRD